MADLPKAKPLPSKDWTSTLVAGGVVVLAAIGLGTIFSETIAAALSPASTPVSEAHPAATATAATDAGRP